MKRTGFLGLLLLLAGGCGGAMAQITDEVPEFRTLEVTEGAVLRIGLLDTDSVSGHQIRIERNKAGFGRSPWIQFDDNSRTLSVAGMEATLLLNPGDKGLRHIRVDKSAILEGSLMAPVSVPDLDVRVSGNAVAKLYYEVGNLSVTATQSASFQGYGKGAIQSQYLRCDGGAYISSMHMDTTPVLRCVAAGMGIIDTRESPARVSYDTLYGSASVTVNAEEIHPVIRGNGLIFNTRDYGEPGNDSLVARVRVVSSPMQEDSSRGPIPLKDFLKGEVDEEDVWNYYDDLEKDWDKGKPIYIEDLFFIGNKPRPRPRFRGQWMGFEVGFPMWGSTYGMNTQMPEGYENLDLDFQRTVSIGWNVFQVSVGFGTPHWGFLTGAGFLWENYFFSYPNTILERKDHRLVPVLDTDPERRYIKSKLGVSYFRIPLLFEYTNARGVFRSVHVSAGVIPSVLMTSWTRQVYREDGDRNHEKHKGNYYVNPFRLDAVVYAGWSFFNVYFRYTPTHFFRAGKVTDITPFGFGVLFGLH